MKIKAIRALEVLDSRGYPTVGARIRLENGTTASALVPVRQVHWRTRGGGAPGRGPGSRYGGKGVQKAVANIRGEINDALTGFDVTDQHALDRRLTELDGTPNKGRLGANAILAVSMAAARAAAYSLRSALYQYLGQHVGNDQPNVLPVPCLNVINGGRHADNTVDFQEFQIAPFNAPTFAEGLRIGRRDLSRPEAHPARRRESDGRRRRRRLRPRPRSQSRCASSSSCEPSRPAGYRPGEDVAICLDPATSELWEGDEYVFFKSDRRKKTTAQMIELWEEWVSKYPIVLIEDALAENDWEGWHTLTTKLGDRIELVGDDVFCTNPSILQKAIDQGVGNSILIKPNQIGTVSETLECIRLAQDNGYGVYVSHRSGDTEDTFIADLAVASGCGHIKTGSGCRGERIGKFNRLLKIENDLDANATYAGLSGFRQTALTAGTAVRT